MASPPGICEILVNLICVSGRPTWTPLQKKELSYYDSSFFSYIPCDEFFEWFVWPLEGDIRFFCQVIQGKAQAGGSAVGQAVFVEVEFRRVVIGTASFFFVFDARKGQDAGIEA